jgi:hypothetical protein
VTLDASASFSTDGRPMTFVWSIKTRKTFNAATGVQPTLTWAQLQALGIKGAGTYVVKVDVTDTHNHFDTVSEETTLTVTQPLSLVAAPSWRTLFSQTSSSVRDAAATVDIAQARLSHFEFDLSASMLPTNARQVHSFLVSHDIGRRHALAQDLQVSQTDLGADPLAGIGLYDVPVAVLDEHFRQTLDS